MQRVFSDKLYSNATYLMLTTIVTSGLGFFFWAIVARFYTVEDVGLATTIISSMMLIATLSVLGFDIGLIRFLPQADLEKSKRMINSCLSISGILSISLVVIFLLGLDFLSPKLLFIRESASFISLFALFTFIWSLSMLVDGIFISQRIAKYVFARSAIFSILKLSVPILVVTLGSFGIFFSWGISALVAFLIAIFYLLPKIILGYRPRFSVNKKI
ncbi:MAG: polysaccharide biosynthesis protein, partial [Candidatus Altiarchaeales archaeon]